MIKFEAFVKKFGQKGEKTGWTYVDIPADEAQKLNPGVRTSYRIKGVINKVSIKQIAILPMGNGDFILVLNADLRKSIQCKLNDKLQLEIELDKDEFVLSPELLESIALEPAAQDFFNTLTNGHQRYFSNWIEDAKTFETKQKRLTMAMIGLSKNLGYPEMIRYFKALKEKNG